MGDTRAPSSPATSVAGPGSASTRTPAASDARAGASLDDDLDLQSLFAASLRRLAQRTACERVCAWWWRAQGEPVVVAAVYARGAPRKPEPADLDALAAAVAHERAFDLGASSTASALRELAARHDFSAGRVVRSREGEPVAVIFVGGGDDPPGAVRPRQLAHLDECGERMADPVSTLGAAVRMRALDQEVRRLDRLSSLGELVTEILHEIRNPLVSVKTFLQLLPGRADDPEFTGEFRAVALEELQRIERLIEAVVQHARPPAAPAASEGTEVGDCLESLAGLLRHRAMERDVTLETRVTGALPRVAMSEDGLRQLLLNLALNAIDAAKGGGRVLIEAAAGEDGVELCVSDDGPGVPVELRERVFEPFFSTRRNGAGGLGLAISRRLVSEAGGQLGVDDAATGGARFRARLPAR